MHSTLSHADQATYNLIFIHPVAHNLEWTGIINIFNHLGMLEEQENNKLKFTRNGQTLTLHRKEKDLDVDDVFRLRHFLQASELVPQSPLDARRDVLVVLDHAGARIYRAGAEGSEPEMLVPLDPSGHDQQVHNPMGDSGGKQGPLRKLFHEALAAKLESAGRILLMGDGTGASSEMDHFTTELMSHHHKDLASRIVDKQICDISHMTEHDFAAKAKEFFHELELPKKTAM